MTTLRSAMVFRTLSDLMLPPRCASCDTWGASPLCASCERDVTWVGREACTRCGAPSPQPAPRCGLCATDTFAFDAAACAAVYDGAARDAIVAFKLAGERRAAEVLGRWLTLAAGRLRKPEAIAWVPSTRRTVAARGFDPAGEIARAFAVLVGMRATPLLRKIRATADQAGLDRVTRRENQAGAFDAAREPPAHVLLVDDILTTGATADACSTVLKRAGCVRVEMLAVARAI